MDQKQLVENLEKCPSYDRCSQNLCPLDLEMHLRVGGESDKCRWMREPRRTTAKIAQNGKILSRSWVTGGSVMFESLLKFVPKRNAEKLNKSSYKRWLGLNNQTKGD